MNSITNYKIIIIVIIIVIVCRCLEVLNVEGNQLAAMPAGALRLKHLAELNVRRNFMHPVFWPDFTRNQPQVHFVVLYSCSKPRLIFKNVFSF